jgi:hypothetical protein
MSQDVTFPVEAGHVLLFARAVLDDRPDYYDPAAPGTTPLAPPTFTQALMHFHPDFEMRPRPGQPWKGSGASASGTLSHDGASESETVLHAEQRYEYHRHIHPGDVLIASSYMGKSWAKTGRRGNILNFSEAITEFRDGSGELVITAVAVEVRIGQPENKVANG